MVLITAAEQDTRSNNASTGGHCGLCVTFLALSSFLLLICKQTPSFAASAVPANAAEPVPGRIVAPGLAALAVPGLDELVLLMVPDKGFDSALPAAQVVHMYQTQSKCKVQSKQACSHSFLCHMHTGSALQHKLCLQVDVKRLDHACAERESLQALALLKAHRKLPTDQVQALPWKLFHSC